MIASQFLNCKRITDKEKAFFGAKISFETSEKNELIEENEYYD